MPAFKSLDGQVFGRLTVLAQAENVGKRTMWTCRCECGQIKHVQGHNLVKGTTRSCGCLMREVAVINGRAARKDRTTCRDCGSPGPLVSKTYCRECRRLRDKKRQDDPVLRESDRASQAGWRKKLKLDAIAAYGGACACCSETQTEFLCIDHIAGDGAAHRRSIGHRAAGHQMYLWLRRHDYPPGLRVLCYNCNMALWLYGRCPHGLEATYVPAIRTERGQRCA